MIIVCEVCGDIGYKKLLIYCRGCEDSASHQYCFNKVVYDGSLADWLCFDCQQRSGEVSCRGSLEVSSERPSHAHSGLILQQSIAKTVESAMDAGPCKGKMKSGKTKYASLNKIYSSKMNSRPKKHNRKKSNVRTMGNHHNRKGYDTVVLGLRSCEAIGTETSKNDNGEDQHPIPLTDNFVDDCNVMDGLMPEKEKHVVRLQLDYRATDELQHRSIAANVTQQAALQDDVMDNVMTCSPNMCILDKEDIENQNMPSEDIENQNRKENQSEPSKMMLTQQAALQDDAMDNVMLCSPNVCILDKEDIENQNMPSQDIENQNRKENQSEPSKMIVTQQATLQDDAMDNVMLCSPNVCILDKEDIENQNMPSEDIENQNRKENQSEPSKMIITQQAALQDDAMDNVMPCSPNMCILDKEDIENQNMPSEDIENQNQKENQSEPSNLFDWASLEIYPAKILPEDISVDFGKDNPRKQRHLILDDDDDDHDEDKAEDVHLENVQSGDLSDSNGSNGGPVEKRRRYVDANEDEDEEADKVEETVQIGDLSYSDCSNGGPVKKRRRYVDANEDEDEEADKVEETVQIGDLSYSDCSNGGPVKKRRRYIDASEDENDDEEAVIDVANASSAQNNVANGVLNDGTNLELQTAIPEEHPPRSRIPSDSDTADQQYYVHSRPIDEPIWSGDFKIKSEVFGQETSVVKHIVHVENEIMVERNCVAQNVAMEIAKREVITLPDSKLSYTKPNSPEDGSRCSVHQRIDTPHYKLCGLVVARTPRAQQLLEEMISEGELVFSVGEQTETTNFCTGSNVGVGSGLNPDTDYQHLHEHPRPFDFISTGHAVPDVASEACLELFPVQQEKIGWAPRVEATKEVDLDLSLGARSQAPSMKL
ncbi:hypothetical protein PR202_gb00465 [Eleusine coracana subsp. coracana]|uniref:Zinc finger PHD-type domain-containing protein n=1 Tax=Eleusine coracana subsp. coracana TaxID=191504 RepID=A0AAV5DTE2_ELECO|nr:hypothetical protein PR202_gb00465 [Eleusine coracana subsp. coracana]